MNTKKFLVIGSSAAVISLMLAGSAFAATASDGVGHSSKVKSRVHPGMMKKAVAKPTVVGTVSVVNGSIVTLTAKNGTVYSVDLTSAKIVRHFGAKMVVSDIQVGDMLMVRGIVTGTSVLATSATDQSLQAKNGHFTGTIASVNGNSFSLQSGSRGIETINLASDAVITKLGQAMTVKDLVGGLNVSVTGVWDKVNNNVTASKVVIIVKEQKLSVTGTVESVSGTSLKVDTTDGKVYSVDASKAHVTYSHGRKGSISIIQTNDTVSVIGKQEKDSLDVIASKMSDASQTFKVGTK